MTDQKRAFGEIKLIAGNANLGLAAKIAGELGLELEKSGVGRFPDGEVKVDLDCVVRGTDVFIIQPICQSHYSPLERPCLAAGRGAPASGKKEVCTYQSINDNLVELLVMIDAARRASAGRITAVVPYMAYAKQEKKKKGHEPITAKLVANLITTAGADRLLTVDLHTPAIEGFFDIPVDHMRMALLMGAHFRDKLGLEDAVVVSPDAGGVARATEFRNHLKAKLAHDIAGDEMAIAFKRRTAEDEPTIIEMVGEVAGRPAVIFDDIIQSGGTLLEVVRLLKKRGATRVHAAIVHADLTPGAAEALAQSPLESLVLSDTTASAREVAGGKIKILSAARILAHAIWRIHTQQSIGWIFDTLGDKGKLPKFNKGT
jgi:ribose-phosphate pyrophosphokinase